MGSDVGFDPVRWVERLRDVAAGSEFRDGQKRIIERRLYDLACELADGDGRLTPAHRR